MTSSVRVDDHMKLSTLQIIDDRRTEPVETGYPSKAGRRGVQRDNRIAA
jgi:hypothetical protein